VVSGNDEIDGIATATMDGALAHDKAEAIGTGDNGLGPSSRSEQNRNVELMGFPWIMQRPGEQHKKSLFFV